MRMDIYDTYEGEKGADFDKWLENIGLLYRKDKIYSKGKQIRLDEGAKFLLLFVYQ